VTAARQFWCALVALVGTLLGTVLPGLLSGCASAPDPLHLAIEANNVAAATLRVLQDEHTARVTADYLARVGLCPHAPADVRTACILAAERDALAALGPERVRLLELELVQHAVATALEAAQVCREKPNECTTSETSALASAARSAARLQKLLEQTKGQTP
jgi:hypothetical protein